MICQYCGAPTKRSAMKFCSRRCKIEAQKGRKEVIDRSKHIRCKIDGKVFRDYLNRSGCLTAYSERVLNKSLDWVDWEIIQANVVNRWRCPYCEWETIDVENKSGWITTHLQTVHQLSPAQHCEKHPVDHKLWSEYWKRHRKEVHKHNSPDNRVQCLECGEYFLRINNRHLLDKHGMTLQEYDQKYPHAVRWSKTTIEKARVLYYSENGLSNANYDSKGQIEVEDFIRGLGFDVKKYRSTNYEIDIYIPDLKIGFEYDGLFHHSEFRSGRGEKYHLGKTKSAENDGIRLIHIFEDEWNYKRDIVKSRISDILGKSSRKIYARRCVIGMIRLADVKKFLDDNHLQGYALCSTAVGLFFDGDLVQCMTFGSVRSKVSKKEKGDGHYELVRACTKIGCNVVGGLSRLLRFAEKKLRPNLIVTYADRRWTSSLQKSVYDVLGFTNVGQTDPCFWGTRRYLHRDHHRSFFTKKNMITTHPEYFEGRSIDSLTQTKMMEIAGYDRIWDCGNFKYIKKYEESSVIPEDDLYEPVEFNYMGSRHRPGSAEKTSVSNVKCQLCDLFYPVRGMNMHLRYTHHIASVDYINAYGEYRPSILRRHNSTTSRGQ